MLLVYHDIKSALSLAAAVALNPSPSVLQAILPYLALEKAFPHTLAPTSSVV
ncbi:hypothetical protein ACU8KH_02813 [Lachancea thermotolerans]